MNDLLCRYIALNNPVVEDKVQEKEPATITTGTRQCHETGSPAHLV